MRVWFLSKDIDLYGEKEDLLEEHKKISTKSNVEMKSSSDSNCVDKISDGQ